MNKLLYFIVIVLFLLTCAGCSSTPATEANIDTEDTASSFVIVEQELLKGYFYRIAYHKETKVMYVLGQYNDFTVMLDAEGKPLLWDGN